MSISPISSQSFAISPPRLYANCTVRDINSLIESEGKGVLRHQFLSSDGIAHRPLHYVLAYWGNVELVHRLVRLGADVNAPDLALGGTALHAFLRG